MGEVIFSGVVAVIAVVLFINSATFPESIIDQTGGAALFPRIIIILLLVTLAVRVVIILRDKEEREKPFAFIDFFKGRRLVFFLLFIGYTLVMTTLGFFLSSSIFLAIAIPFLYKLQHGKFMSVKRLVISTVISTSMVFALYYIFVNYFNVILPSGILGI